MKQLVAFLGFLTFLWAPSVAHAQLYPPNQAGVTLAAWHTIVRDVEATKKYWELFDGEPTKIDGVDVMKLPGVLVFLHPGEPTAPSAGAVIDHVAVNCQNCFDLIKRIRKAGYQTDEVDPKTMRGLRETEWVPRAWTYVYTPDGMKIEMETNPCSYGAVHPAFVPTDPVVPCPEKMPGYVKKLYDPAGAIGSDQLHLYPGSYADIIQVLKFYKANFGAVSINYSNLNITIPGFIGITAETKKRPTNKGRALDSVGLEVTNLEAFCKKLEAAGVKFDEPYSKTRHTSYAHASFTDNWGIPIQLTEGLAKFAKTVQPAPPQLSAVETRGKKVFDNYCAWCHSITSTDVQYDDAPGLLGEFKKPPHKLWGGKGKDAGPGQGKEYTATEQSVREIIVIGTRNSGGRMPAEGAGLTNQDLEDVIAYVKTL